MAHGLFKGQSKDTSSTLLFLYVTMCSLIIFTYNAVVLHMVKA